MLHRVSCAALQMPLLQELLYCGAQAQEEEKVLLKNCPGTVLPAIVSNLRELPAAQQSAALSCCLSVRQAALAWLLSAQEWTQLSACLPLFWRSLSAAAAVAAVARSCRWSEREPAVS
jgi:hypothetical protein